MLLSASGVLASLAGCGETVEFEITESDIIGHLLVKTGRTHTLASDRTHVYRSIEIEDGGQLVMEDQSVLVIVEDET